MDFGKLALHPRRALHTARAAPQGALGRAVLRGPFHPGGARGHLADPDREVPLRRAELRSPAVGEGHDSFTGSEIEQVFIEARYRAFEQEQEPTDLTIGSVLVDSVPLSKLMGESMTALRTWAKGRARPATTPPAERSTRRIAA